ncbi:MAG TPA: hypothetical protein VM597_16800 [Gemmataceae bacterium]|jgi:hypothetical protein|nr:hypothetical protein [Gemmataceae bacterium]
MTRRHGPAEFVVYLTLAAVLGGVGFLVGFVGTRFLCVLLFGYRVRYSYALAFDLVSWSVAIVAAGAGLKGAYLVYRRHFPALPKAGDPRPDYDDGREAH